MNHHDDLVQLITDLVLTTFQLNGALLRSGDALVGDLGLSSARWQVLGAVALATQPPTVAQVARRMGLSRQAVQRIANDLSSEGLVRFVYNPDHKRAKRLELTDAGQTAYANAMHRQRRWAEALATDLDANDLRRSVDLMNTLIERLNVGLSTEKHGEKSRHG